MDIWYSVSLGDGITAATPTEELEAAFRQAFTSAGSPPDMAVFTRPESEGRLYCEIIAYFSPAAQTVARAFDAQACEKPVRRGLALLAGTDTAWSALFPDEL